MHTRAWAHQRVRWAGLGDSRLPQAGVRPGARGCARWVLPRPLTVDDGGVAAHRHAQPQHRQDALVGGSPVIEHQHVIEHVILQQGQELGPQAHAGRCVEAAVSVSVVARSTPPGTLPASTLTKWSPERPVDRCCFVSAVLP